MHKYIIGQKVFVYDSGKLVEKTIQEIQVTITESKTRATYLFKEDGFNLYDYGTKESEVFESIEHFANQTMNGFKIQIKPTSA